MVLTFTSVKISVIAPESNYKNDDIAGDALYIRVDADAVSHTIEPTYFDGSFSFTGSEDLVCHCMINRIPYLYVCVPYQQTCPHCLSLKGSWLHPFLHMFHYNLISAPHRCRWGDVHHLLPPHHTTKFTAIIIYYWLVIVNSPIIVPQNLPVSLLSWNHSSWILNLSLLDFNLLILSPISHIPDHTSLISYFRPKKSTGAFCIKNFWLLFTVTSPFSNNY